MEKGHGLSRRLQAPVCVEGSKTQRWTQLWSLPNKEGQRADGRTTEGPRVHLLPPSQHIQNLNQVAPRPESVGTYLVTPGKWNSIPAEEQPARYTLGHRLKISRDQV